MSNSNFEEQQKSNIVARPDEIETPVDIENLKQELADARKKADEYLASWQRAQADFINYKRRLEQDRDEAVKYAHSGIILQLLPILDDFELAMKAAPIGQDNAPWLEGISGIIRKFLKILESQGLSEIKALGEKFDPCVHDAMLQVPGAEGIVMQELQKGYRFKDRILRHSRVAVGNGSKPEETSHN